MKLKNPNNRPRQNYLIAQGYDPSVTRLDRPALGTPGTAMGQSQPRTGPMRTNDIPFTLVGGAPSINIATANSFRRGLILTNKDPVDNLYFKFGGSADANSAFLVPRQYLLLDVTTPTDSVWVFATSDISAHYMDFAPTA